MDETTSLLLVAPSETCRLFGLCVKSPHLHHDTVPTILALRRIDISWNAEILSAFGRSVAIYISPDGGMTLNVYPWPDEESLREALERGKITYNDYRKKIGLDPATT